MESIEFIGIWVYVLVPILVGAICVGYDAYIDGKEAREMLKKVMEEKQNDYK